MVLNGYWQQRADTDPTLYPAVTDPVHRADLATYVAYAGAVPDWPRGSSFSAWNRPSTRAWFSRAEWQALDSYFGSGFVP